MAFWVFGVPSGAWLVWEVAQSQFNAPTLGNLLSPFQWLQIGMYYLLFLLVFAFILFITGAISYQKQEHYQLGELTKSNKGMESELLETRRKLREKEDFKVCEIPHTLRLMTTWYQNTAKTKSDIKVEPEKLQMILHDLFDVQNVTEIINVTEITRKEVSRSIKSIKKRMGVLKKNTKNAKEWAKRIYTVMDDNGVGLCRRNDSEYMKLEETLISQSDNISETKIYGIIWDYVDNSYASYSLKLFVSLGDVKAVIHHFPLEARNLLKQIDEKLIRASGSGIAQISHVLEGYRIGETFDEKQ